MINWGIIGCGNVTEVKSGPAFNKVRNSRLLAVMRRDAALAADYAKRHNVPRYYSNADDLINDTDVNAVYIATPPGSHAMYALRALQAGKPVYIEKPMAANYGECIRINEAAAKYGQPVFVAYYRRTLPGFLKIRELIEEGHIGQVRFVQIQIFKYLSPDEKAGKLPWRVIPEISGAGHFFDLASHQLDYLDFLFGPVQKTAAVAVNQANLYRAEDMVSASFVFPGNIVASGTWNFSSVWENRRDSLEIFGERGMIKTSTFSFEPIVVVNDTGRQEYENARPENVQYFLIEQIVNSLTEGGPVVSTGISAARTSRVMDEVVQEYYRNTDQPAGSGRR
ncbi:MAG TPA: Gfo/Idh/MocA family oxidoreductase [Bacteroidales bacterium]|jgi:predicted dehydrogenase|nr:Gfo/Idh/MocA family oxidoreductase [Bacteroidales bacterium]HPV15898.1 Gfo/Idh/MocA family oxidoreductase [Bacteroidales bacterium]HQG78113.1 Gfo/Idh/MocA family oxidoreductase [Bacteroidales bacterium]